MDVNANVFSLSGALKVKKYLWKNFSRLVFTSYNRDDKKFSNTYEKFFRGWNDTSHECFFSQALDVA